MHNKYKNLFILICTWLVIVLFVYTASDKLLNYYKFKAFLERLEYLENFSGILALAIPTAEILISVFLLFSRLRTGGLYAAFGLMICFTLYLVYMRVTRTGLPCHCGGAISKLTWLQHIWFNLGLLLMLYASILWSGKKLS